jgi:hypothetical protein
MSAAAASFKFAIWSAGAWERSAFVAFGGAPTLFLLRFPVFSEVLRMVTFLESRLLTLVATSNLSIQVRPAGQVSH